MFPLCLAAIAALAERASAASVLAAPAALTSLLEAPLAFEGYFLHGVASGDPRSDAVVIWTRISPRIGGTAESLPVAWRIWPSHAEDDVANLTGMATARPSSDFTVKVDARPLRWGVRYFYQFTSGAAFSPVGTFKLPPPRGEPLENLRYAIFSCSNWRWGTFAAYGKAALEQLDFWMHLGDFIYEHGMKYPDPDQAARPGLDPPHETVTLQDYRRRYALYRTDEDLQALSASAPSVSMWDDHEVANDIWMEGGENHQPKAEGKFSERKRAALKAYHEWLPTLVGAEPSASPSEEQQTRWRSFDFGDLATLLLLETRLNGRTSQLGFTGGMVRKRIDEIVGAPGAPPPEEWKGTALERRLLALKREAVVEASLHNKTILGKEQLEWVGKKLRETSARGTRWSLIGQQLKQVVAPMDLEGAVRLAEESQSARVRSAGAHWRASLSNASKIGSSYSFDSPMPYAKAMRGMRFNITHKQKLSTLRFLAAGRYGINSDFDSWDGYLADRARLLSEIAGDGAAVGAASGGGSSGGTIVYGGDSHNAWAGRLREGRRVVAHEFDTMSVSAPGFEVYSDWLPADFVSAAWAAPNPDLAWADVRHRGYTLVELTKAAHEVVFIGVDSSEPGRTAASRCLAMFATAAGRDELMRGRCRDAGTLSRVVGNAGAAAAAQSTAALHSGASNMVGVRQRIWLLSSLAALLACRASD